MSLQVLLMAGVLQAVLEGQSGVAVPPQDVTEVKKEQEERPPPLESSTNRFKDDLFLDMDGLETAGYVCFVAFSNDFRVDPEVGAGFLLRAPSPWLSRDVLGCDEDDLALFVDCRIVSVERDLGSVLERSEATLLFATVGVDYLILQEDALDLLAHTGLQYGDFGGARDLDNGFAAVVGLTAIVRLSKNVAITYRPDWAFADAGDSILFNSLGVLIKF